MFIILADHGMELQDPSREAGPLSKISKSGVKVKQPFAGVLYLRTLEMEASAGPEEGTITVHVRNHDNDTALYGVTVSCPAGCTETEAFTDDTGAAVFHLDGAAAELELSAAHPSFNIARLVVSSDAL